MDADSKVLVMGEDVGKLGGVFRVTDGLQKDFGEDRVIDTPLAESGIIGTAIGLALRGYRPVCEIQFDGFVFPASDQIVTQLAKMHAALLGKLQLPVVVRIPCGGGIGAVEHHSESPEAYFTHTAGLRVVACSNPVDAYRMIQEAVRCDDPVVFFEPKRRYWDKADVRVRRARPAARPGPRRAPGDDVTLVAYGPMVKTSPGGRRGRRGGRRARSGSSTCARCTRSTCRWSASPSSAPAGLVVVHEAPVFNGLGAEIAARVTEQCFYRLEAPVLRVGGVLHAVSAVAARGRVPAPTSTGSSRPSTASSATKEASG